MIIIIIRGYPSPIHSLPGDEVVQCISHPYIHQLHLEHPLTPHSFTASHPCFFLSLSLLAGSCGEGRDGGRDSGPPQHTQEEHTALSHQWHCYWVNCRCIPQYNIIPTQTLVEFKFNLMAPSQNAKPRNLILRRVDRFA